MLLHHLCHKAVFGLYPAHRKQFCLITKNTYP
nr:MAG TPA: hypothetical protein [Caudoviricetes sp.]